MAKQIQHRRGSTTEHASFTGAQGEITYNTTTKTLHTHDGLTASGFPLARADELAGPNGASKVGYTPAGTGAVATNVQSKLREFVSVKDFGAVGDGVTDDTTAIQAALDYGAANGIRVVGQGTFKISSKVVIKGDADFSQATFNVYSTPAVAVDVSTGNAPDPTTNIVNAVIWLPKRINNMTKPGRGWISQGVGVRVVNAYSCQLFVGNVVNFATGLLMTSFGSGNVYNNVYLSHLENNQINLALTPGNASAWVNENNFIGGRFSHYSHEGTNVSGTRHILLSKATHAVNNNLFMRPSVEGDAPEYHVENGGCFNTIQQGRWESTPPKVLYTADNANQGSSNYIFGGYGASAIVITYAGGVGGNLNRLYGTSNDYVTVNVGQKFTNQSSSASPIYLFYEAGTRPESAASTEWSVQHGAQSLQGKRKADSYARLKLDYANGRISLDNGTTENPTAYISAYGANDLILAGTSWRVATDNTYSLGTASLRWSTVYAGTGTINTSDEREKQQIRTINDAEKAVAVKLKSLVRAFKFNDAVQSKGDGARIHIGVIAQEVMSAFQAEGLDPTRYAILCYDEWEAEPEELGEEGNVTKPAREAGNRYGVRYEELLAFIIAAL